METQCEKKHYTIKCPVCKEVMVRTHYQNEEGDWFICWLCGCEPDPLVYEGDRVMANEYDEYANSVQGSAPSTLRDVADRIIKRITVLEGMLEGVVGPKLKSGEVPTRGEGSLFSLESDLVLIEVRLDGVADLVREIAHTI